ncbi:MAG TPA: HDOD domain-containing protein, partial [Acidisoma sp.]|nr:HDOD domain-containing protein [Acidisoma sp.]
LIRTVNSASVGLTRNITSISEVVSFLGFGIIRSMVIRLRLNEILVAKNEQDAQDMEDLWVHSLAVSYAATNLALRVPDVDGGFVATLGLLHDIGKMALLAQLPEQTAELRRHPQCEAAISPLVREASLLGTDHAGLGANLAAAWQLPADLIQGIRKHHNFVDPFHSTDPLSLRKALHVVQIADQLAKYCYAHADCVEINAIPDDVFELLGLEPSLPKLLDEKMRAAIGRAIFFAEANSQHAIARPGRFLRPLSADAARELLNAAPGGELRVDQDDAAITAMFSAHVPALDDNAVDNNEIPSIARSIAHARLS